MERVIQSNIYSDFFYMLFGVIGATIYYMKGSYILGSILAVYGIVYLVKILEYFFKKNQNQQSPTE
ncbi:hypothetical protein [Zobellia nedashkovskayae]|uniref:hypothetical protein n=1 Tax=Zobellia nedashkovskayae TaxID=2779510 RepID=UPI00188C356B|nr:hypothetical protein [Zobellia nedashkovskayae]